MYFKWIITKTRGNGAYIQLADFTFYDASGEKIPFPSGTSVTSTLASTNSSETIDKIIDDNSGTKYCASWNKTEVTILFSLPEDISPSGYGYMTANDSSDRDPVSWELYYSDDGENYTLLDTQSEAEIPTTRKQATQIWSLNLITVTHKYLIYDEVSGQFYNVADDALHPLEINELTAETFLTYGNKEKPPEDLLLTLSKFKLYCWTNEAEAPVLSAVVEAIPEPQMVVTNEIDLTDETITGIETVTVVYEGNPLFALSFDGGNTWKMHNGTVWVEVSEEESGMYAETMEAIDVEQWQEVVLDHPSFMIRFMLSGITDTVTSITVDFTN